MIVGGVLVFVGLSFLVEWVFDKRRSLPVGEYVVVLVILLSIATRGFLPGVVRRAGARGRAVRDQLRPDRAGARGRVRGDVPQQRRPTARRARGPAGAGRTRPDPPPERVRVLRDGERPARADPQARGSRTAPVPGDRPSTRHRRRLVGCLAFRKVAQLAEANGFELVFAGASDGVRAQLRRGGLVPSEVVRFEPDLDRGLQRCEDVLLEEAGPDRVGGCRRGRSPAAAPDAVPRTEVAPGRDRADPPGRSARRRVRAGIGSVAGGDSPRPRARGCGFARCAPG